MKPPSKKDVIRASFRINPPISTKNPAYHP